MTRKAIITLIAGLTVLSGLSNYACAQTTRPFEPGEIIVGYKSSNDRDTALQQFMGAKDSLSVRGQKINTVHVQAMGPLAVKLRINLPADVKMQAATDPTIELAVLRELAAQIMSSDARVKYAHPNWILDKLSSTPRFNN
jgi:hypothetical protein